MILERVILLCLLVENKMATNYLDITNNQASCIHQSNEFLFLYFFFHVINYFLSMSRFLLCIVLSWLLYVLCNFMNTKKLQLQPCYQGW
jgi:hypothetical protein